MSRVIPPPIDVRTATHFFRRIREMVPHYTREWPAKDDDDPGVGLLNIFSFLVDGVIQRLNRAPERNFLCFLDMLGIRLLPKTPAVVPVRFLVSTGATEPVLVSVGTQVSATATALHDELPFETTQRLLVVPGALIALIAVDPSRDVILKPPPGFLELEIATAPRPLSRVAAFSSAGSNSLQLDLVDQLQKGDFLRIRTELTGALASQCCSPAQAVSTILTDHLIVSDIKANIVFVRDPLPRDYAVGTEVEKVTRFDLLDGKNFQEHILFLGHADLFNIKSEAQFELVFVHATGSASNLDPLRIAWEFYGATETDKQEAWRGLTLELDGTSGLSTDGRIILTKPAGEIKETEISGNKNRWIRARVIGPIPATPPPSLPGIESVLLRVSSTGDGLLPDLAFHNDTPLQVDLLAKSPSPEKGNVEAELKPFGAEPQTFDRFYLASKEAFSKRGAEVAVKVTLDTLDTRDPADTDALDFASGNALNPEVSWEYWNGTGWVTLNVTGRKPLGRADATAEHVDVPRFLTSEDVTFQIPDDITNTAVAGQDNFWIRARIVGGDYGHALFYNEEDKQWEYDEKRVRPPRIKGLAIQYSFSRDLPPQVCLSFNNLNYLNQTDANNTPDKYFSPFEPLPDTQPTVYFGFDKSIREGPVRLYAAARELQVDELNRPKFAWAFEADNQWEPALAEDNSNAFTRPEIITLSIPGEFQKRKRFGEELYWVRANLVEGVWSEAPVLSGLFLNTAMARHSRTFLNEILGSSDGTAGQLFRFVQHPVLEGPATGKRDVLTEEERRQLNEEVRVAEVLTDEERRLLKDAEGEDVIIEIPGLDGGPPQSWVRWREVIEFFDSAGTSRHYRLDRASGEIEFGDGVHGKIPAPGGDNVRAFSYQAGGGKAGNVRAGEIKSLITSVGGIDSVINPMDAGGGSEEATSEEMLEIGPAQISNRGRAVTPEDFEWLAKEASREVRKARCVPNQNDQGSREPGWVSVFVVPDSKAPAPMPSFELRRAVTRYLSQRADLNIVGQEHIFVGAPEYVRVGVQVTVFARSIDETALAERNVRQKLAEFLHPLTGGPEGTGWEFGRKVATSDIYRLLEGIEEVDHVGPVQLLFSDTESVVRAEVGTNALIAAGEHIVSTLVANGG
jgi:hypothetical protein